MSRLLHELLRWQRTAGAVRWRSWARALADRHAHLVGQFRRPWMALVPAGLPGVRHEHRHWAVTRNLHLAVRPVLAALPGTGGAPAAASPPAALVRRAVTSVPRRVESPAPPLQRVVVHAAALQADADDPASPYPRQALLVQSCLRTLERVVEERRRVEHWTRPAAADGARPAVGATDGARPAARAAGGRPPGLPPAPAPLAPPRPPVLATERRPAGTTASPGATPASAAPSGPGPGWGGAAPREAAQPRIDIAQLTDQVVRQIDREIVAHRERLGRI
jgi:hypothetical protein